MVLIRPGKNQDVVQKFEETIGQEHESRLHTGYG
jgi:hypothetical protein